ncbi:MAG TPA: phenylalanine--tRNA ligase beta subunit-related protein [Steroidobacteraceae bacterium]|nr:phenylalanine--tRNA ligase beta subunit-related protein [Steroidobacteraceae bacterium]
MAPVPKSLSTRIRVDAAVRTRFPAFEGRLVYALDIENGPSDAHTRALLSAAAEHALASAGGAPAAHPRIAAWRDAYRAFGAKASAYPCSVEALLQRARKGGAAALPAINRLVDAYNAVSLQHLLPVGGEDLDRLVGDLVLRFATGDESFDGTEAGAAESGAAVIPGEVVWADDAGVTCRRWNWRQGRRTRLTEASRNAYFIIEGMGAASDVLDAAAAALAEHARALANARNVYVLPL